jgi:hypothetical protein
MISIGESSVNAYLSDFLAKPPQWQGTARTRFPGAAQHGAKRSDAPQTRDRSKFRAFDDPGSAVHRYRAAPHPGNTKN